MADQSATLFGALQHSPGNPQFPTLPGAADPTLGKTVSLGFAAELRIAQIEVPKYTQSAAGANNDGFGSWYLNQIFVTPTPVDFGNISDVTNVDVTVYSTYFETVTFSGVNIPIPAIDITVPVGSPIFPLALLSFSDAQLTFTAEQFGPQTFDDYTTFTVNGISFEVRFVGRRVLLLFGEPENGAVETLQFFTDYMRAKDGTEQVFSLRLAPYSQIEYVFRLPYSRDSKRTEIEALLIGGAPNLPIGMQLWWEAQKITSAAVAADTTINVDTSYMQIAVGETICFNTPSNTNEIGTIASFTANSVTLEQAIGATLPEGTYAMPVRYGHLTGDPTLSTRRMNLHETTVTLRTEADVDISNLDTNYFDLHPSESPGRAILTSRCLKGASISGAITREVTEIDGKTGRVHVTGTEPLGEWSSQVHVWLRSKAEIRAWREFLHLMRGGWGTFYLPTFQNDLPLYADIILGSNTFTVPYMGIFNYLNAAAPYRDLLMRLEDGTSEYKRITSVVDNGNGTETITVDSVIGSTGFSSIEGTMISWMHLVRIAGDAASFSHIMLGEAELSFRVRSVKE